MAHLVVIRYCQSFVEHPDAILGTHEQIEKEINQRKYTYNDVRKGYCIPYSSEWKIMDYRVKKEVIADFAYDLGYINLNPYPNNMTLWKVFSNKDNMRTIGRGFKFAQWVFKWLVKLKLTRLKPVPYNVNKIREPFCPSLWRYDIILGQLEDPTETLITGDEHEDTL